MTFDEILAQVVDLLQRQGRVSYRALKRRFDLDEDYLEDLKAELIKAQRSAVDEDGEVLVWTGDQRRAPPPDPGFPLSDQQRSRREDQPTQTVSPPAEPRTPEAERRQLTVLFCDLVDSTTLASQLDPEELRAVVRAYQAACAAVIQRFEGHIAQYLGDGLLVYFGYPQAHEDDAHRAVRAGLGMVEAVGYLNTRLERDKGVHLAVRLGIHTGVVVVGEIGEAPRHELLALGESPNLAARLQDLAEPDTVVISAATYRLIQGLFECRALGPHTMKGVSTPVPVYRVVGGSGAQSRFEVAIRTGLTPLVGREEEVGLLLRRWEKVKAREGQVVLLSGEAGIGKSRLVQVLKAHVAGEPYLRWECRCSPYYQNSALYPVIDLFQRALQFERDDAPDEKLRKLERALAAYPMSLPEVVPLLASLLSLPPPDHYPPLTLSPQQQRQKTLEAVVAVLLAQAAQQPVLLIVEDLHWVDPSTLELLNLLIDQVPTARIFALLTCRPEFRPPSALRAHLTQLMLSRLARAQVEVMVDRVVGDKLLPAEVRQLVVTKTDGVPLFVEELTNMVLESGLLREQDDHYELTGPLPPLAIPATLHDSLMARLDRLAAVKEGAQLGSTIDRSFSYELLEAVSPWDERTLQQALAQLVEAELLYQRGVPPQATYLFKHALIQEAAHQSLLKSRRQQYHQRIAQMLAERFPDVAATQPELLAHHYTEAGLSAQAVPYWQRAGRRAIERSANAEAIGHLTRGLEVLKTLPDTVERAQQELSLQMTLGPALMAMKGHAAPEVEQVHARARALCRQVGETPRLLQVLLGLETFYFVCAKLQTARELGEQCLALSQQMQDPARLPQAHLALGSILFFLGELVLAREHLGQSIALYVPQRSHSRAVQDPGVGSLSYMAWTLWLLGYSDQALERSQEALALANRLSQPFNLASALSWAAMLHQFRREWHLVQERAEATAALSTEQGFPVWVAMGTILRGSALAERGQGENGLLLLQQGIAGWRATGAEVSRPYFLGLLAEACGKAGQTEEGLSVLAEALAAVDNTGERCYEAELNRLQGELLLARSAEHHAEGETCFRQALDVARCQGAKALELRAAMSLSRLWQRQGKRDAARELLADVYGWFTEGFDTADLQEAKALLEALP